MNLHTCAKFGPDRSSGLEAFPDLWIDDPLTLPCPSGIIQGVIFLAYVHSHPDEYASRCAKFGPDRSRCLASTGLDIGYVPAGPHAFLRLSGQFGPLQLIFHWPEGPVDFFFFFLVLRMPPLFLLGIGKTWKATLIRTYFFVIYGHSCWNCW